MNIPKDLKYTKDHEWTRVDGQIVTVGITDHAQSSLGDVVFLELPQVGTSVKKGESFGTVESVKAVSDLYAPVSGKVTGVNEALANEPARINSDPYRDAWMVKLEVTDSSSLDELMDADAYTKYVKSLG